MKLTSVFKLSLVLVATLFLHACAQHQSLYYWGEYEPMVYDMYANPGEADPETQILKLSELIEKAQSYGKKVPPGVYAHLGMAHAQVGNPSAALDAFKTEKSLYPESSVFLDGIIKRSKLEPTLSQASPQL